MPKYKRRVIYMSDEEWFLLSETAKSYHRTMSEHIRHELHFFDPLPPGPALAQASDNAAAAIEELAEGMRDAAQGAQRRRDAVLRKVNRASK